MEYFAGLDISMEEMHLCVVDREGTLVAEDKTASTPETIAASPAKAPACRRIVFETGRMAPMLYHGLAAFGLPVVCIESRQAYQVLKSLATHKSDRNDARGWRTWIYRRHDQEGFGATMDPGQMPHHDFRFNNMADLAKAHQEESKN